MAYCTGGSVSTADDRCSEHSTPSRQRSRAFEATTLDPTDEAMEWSVLEESCRSAFTSDETAMSPVSGLESELTSAALALEPMAPPEPPELTEVAPLWSQQLRRSSATHALL